MKGFLPSFPTRNVDILKYPVVVKPVHGRVYVCDLPICKVLKGAHALCADGSAQLWPPVPCRVPERPTAQINALPARRQRTPYIRRETQRSFISHIIRIRANTRAYFYMCRHVRTCSKESSVDMKCNKILQIY